MYENSEIDDIFNRQLGVYGREGQEKLLKSTILMIGCGGLGSSVGLVLSRSGVGHIVIVDCDVVSITNLHRQILYNREDIGKPKVEVASKHPLFCFSKITPINTKVDEKVAEELIKEYNPVCVMDCTDSFTVRFAVNKACAKLGVPFINGSVTGMNGQVTVLCHNIKYPNCPCYKCLHPEDMKPLDTPPPVAPCICTTIGTLQAEQAISLITGVGNLLIGEFLTIDLKRLKMNKYKLKPRNPECTACKK